MITYQPRGEMVRHPQAGTAIRSVVKRFAQCGIQMWQRSAVAGQGDRKRRPARSVSPKARGQSPDSNAIRVFLVDDHPAVREGISRLLASDPRIKVIGAVGIAEECMKELEKQAVDVILMDINLPGIDGIQATRQLKAEHPELKIVMLSSFGEKYLNQAVQAGADGFLMKTTGKIELVNAVVQAVRGCTPIIDSKLTTSLLDRLVDQKDESTNRGNSDAQ